MLADLMHELAKDFELPGFPSEKEDTYTIPLDENLEIKVSAYQQGMLLFCSFAPIPSNNKEAFLQFMLHGNLFGQGTRDAVLGISMDVNLLTLSKAVAYTPNYKDFKDIVEDFINMVDYWRDAALKGQVGVP